MFGSLYKRVKLLQYVFDDSVRDETEEQYGEDHANYVLSAREPKYCTTRDNPG